MGSTASKEERNWYKVQKEKTKIMYAQCTRYETALVGNNESGKTSFIRRLTNEEFDGEYEETI